MGSAGAGGADFVVFSLWHTSDWNILEETLHYSVGSQTGGQAPLGGVKKFQEGCEATQPPLLNPSPKKEPSPSSEQIQKIQDMWNVGYFLFFMAWASTRTRAARAGWGGERMEHPRQTSKWPP